MYPLTANCESVFANEIDPLVTPAAESTAEFALIGDELSTTTFAAWYCALYV